METSLPENADSKYNRKKIKKIENLGT